MFVCMYATVWPGTRLAAALACHESTPAPGPGSVRAAAAAAPGRRPQSEPRRPAPPRRPSARYVGARPRQAIVGPTQRSFVIVTI
jgi:hypothetical protein